MNSQVLRDYARIAGKYPNVLSGEALTEALAEIDSIILKGRYKGGALVEYRAVQMPSGYAQICNVCVICQEVSSRRKRQIPLVSFLQSYKFITGDAASV